MIDGPTRAARWLRCLGAVALAALLSAGCVVEEPTITSTGQGPPTAIPTQVPLPSPPVFADPTPTPPLPPTATPLPTPGPTATPEPSPTPLPPPTLPPLSITPLPTVDPVEPPRPVAAGLINVPVAGSTAFVLAAERPILVLPGHTLIYVDDQRMAEVDIFTPVATGDGTLLAGLDDVADYLGTNPAFADFDELAPTTVAGFDTRVFEGTIVQGERGFYATTDTISNQDLGWFPPLRARMWLIDTPGGVVAVTAETLQDPGQFSESLQIATEILATITFRP